MPRSTTLALPPAAPASPGPLHAFADHFDYVCRVLRRLGVVEVHVEDLAQDVFLITCRRWADYRPDLPLRPWLAGIAFHVARKHLARVWRETPAGDVELEDDTPQPDERLASERARALAIRCLASLGPRDRVVLSLHDIDGVPVRDVAERLSVPIFTVYTRLRRARKRFALRVRELQAQPAGAGTPRREHLPVRALLPALGAGHGAGRPPAPVPPSPSPRSPPPPVWKVAAVSGASAAAAFALFVTLVHRPAAPQAAALSAPPVAGDDRTLADRSLAAARQRPVLVAPGRVARSARSGLFRSGPAPANAGRALPALAPAAPSPFTASLTEGLAGYWRFDEGRGSAVSRDLSPAGRDCALRAVDPERAWIDGSLGGAVDVGNGWIECPRPPQAAQVDSEVSAAAWVRLAGAPPRNMAIVSRQLGEGREDHFFLGVLKGKLRVRSSLWSIQVNGQALPLGRWVHVAFTHAADGSTRLYQDGVEVGRSLRSYQRGTVRLATPLAIGAGINGPGDSRRAEQLAGAIDEVIIHDRALAPAEVAALAAGEQPPSAR